MQKIDLKIHRILYLILGQILILHSSTFSKKLTQMLRQSVNDNSNGNLSFKSILTIIEIIFKTINLKVEVYIYLN